MLRKSQGERLKPDPAFAFCQAPSLVAFAMGGTPRAGLAILYACLAAAVAQPLSHIWLLETWGD